MKKILYVLNADWYFNLHWKERAINALSNGFSVHVALPSCCCDIAFELKSYGIIIHTFSMDRSSLSVIGEIYSMMSLNKLINKVEPDVVHSVTIKPNLYATILCRLKGINLVSTYAGLGTLKTSTTLAHRFARFLIFSAIKFSSKNNENLALFENQEDLEYFREKKLLCDERLIRVFGAGVNLKEYSYSLSSNKGQELNILFASRLLKDKGLVSLVKAVKILKEKNYNVNLNVAGIFDFDSPLSFTQEQIESLSNAGDIIWLGKRDDMPELIRGSDVVALPTSYGEGVPRILIESCAIGRPVITTPLGGCKDICINESNGYLVSPHDIQSIANALEKIYLDVDLINVLGKNGRELVESRFSNESIFEQNVAIYNNMVNSL
ncbi:glycosyltransferase family 4 protein [Vibrio sp. Evd11]|uniref:glycosyltransferase family 4 protein n=1 Tax=Vibrio sp. Evd11 TaxID=1207404 RepID=UPI000EFA60A3|nr:glycosyltransferase family 4 protein [Vibrio sp. Evd11]